MAKYNKSLLQIASKLGLSEEEKVLSKAAEFERLLQSKLTSNSNITDLCKIVICLDLAASRYGADIDVKMAIKYSGLKNSVYTNSKNIVENILELNSERLTAAALCLLLQCTGVQELADCILEKYQEQAKMKADLNLPHYVCMAVYQACRINKAKVLKSKIIEKSRLKPAQWSKLDVEWTKFVDEHFAAAKAKKGRPAKKAVEEVHEEQMDIGEINQKDQSSEPEIEPYEVWKNRVLAEAYKQIEMDEKHQEKAQNKRETEKHKPENYKNWTEKYEKETVKSKKESEKQATQINTQTMSPRRSPRKTPQKYEPYKSPAKPKGVRLLFPSHF